jgi:nitrogen-specific signal transduction histidine kinase
LTQDSVVELSRQNAALAARVAELSRELARAEAFAKVHAGVVHDLRNAFHVTLMAAEALNLALDDPMDRELASSIVTAADHGSALARDLLALARKEDAKTTVISCAECLGRLQRLIHRFELEQIECRFCIPAGVGSVFVERAQLEAALINLSVNARDAMPSGGRLEIGVRRLLPDELRPAELPPGAYVEFSIRDTGAGMPPSVLAHATEAFFTTKGAKGGTGLGLAMAESFATRSGGALEIESELDHGTTVRLVLPLAAEPEAAKPANPELSAKIDEIGSRVRAAALKDALSEWKALCPPRGVPRAVEIEASLAAQAERMLVLTVDSHATPPAFRLLRIGSALAESLGRRSLGDLSLEGTTTVGTLAAAYRRAFQSRFPSYEYASYTFDEAPPAVFERLILPASVGGNTVTHLLGLIHLSESLHVQGETEHVRDEQQ